MFEKPYGIVWLFHLTLMHTSLNIFVALVWLMNGLFFKLFNLAPRHQAIVARILGKRYAFLFTKIIGALEVLMSAWIVSGFFYPLCAIIQIVVIMVMNAIEFIIASDLLLFRKANIVIAMLFCTVIYINAFIL